MSTAKYHGNRVAPATTGGAFDLPDLAGVEVRCVSGAGFAVKPMPPDEHPGWKSLNASLETTARVRGTAGRMKAVAYTAYGGPEVVEIADVPTPTPKDDEVLVRVRAVALNPLDWRVMRGSPYIFRKMYGSFRAPSLRPGRDVAGDVETVGKNVTRFKPGDAVFGFCRGGLAEYACMPETRIVHKPQNVTYEQGACVPVAGITALQALRDHGQLQAGQSVLINGAAGGVGTFAVQMAKTVGASVTAVCSERNATLLTSLGADRVVDYVRTDFTTASTRYDLIIDNVANHPLSAYRRVLARSGRCVIVGAPKRLSMLTLLRYFAEPKLRSRTGPQTFVTFITKANDRDLPIIAAWMAEGKVVPAIDSIYSLGEAAAAIAHLEAGHVSGKVLVGLYAAENRSLGDDRPTVDR